MGINLTPKMRFGAQGVDINGLLGTEAVNTVNNTIWVRKGIRGSLGRTFLTRRSVIRRFSSSLLGRLSFGWRLLSGKKEKRVGEDSVSESISDSRSR